MPIKIVKEKTIEDHFICEMEKAFPTAMILKYEVRRNEPDRVCLLPGANAVFVELKRPKKHPRSGQERALNRLRDLGFEAHYANTKETVDALIAHLLERQARGWV